MKKYKKILIMFAVIGILFLVTACKNDDPAEKLLSDAKIEVATLITNTDEVVGDLTVKAKLQDGEVDVIWSSSNEANAMVGAKDSQDNVLIKITRPKPGDGNKTAKLTAKLSIESEMQKKTLEDEYEVTITILESAVEISTIANAKTASLGDLVKITGVITSNVDGGKTYFIQDDTGGIAIEVPSEIKDDFNYTIGDTITILGELDKVSNLFLLKNFLMSDVEKETGDKVIKMPNPVDITGFPTSYFQNQGKLVNLLGCVLFEDPRTESGVIRIRLINKDNNEIIAFIDGNCPNKAALEAALNGKKAGDAIDIKKAILSSDQIPILQLFDANSISEGEDYTDQELAEIAFYHLRVPKSGGTVTMDVNLPNTAMFNGTIAWVSSLPMAISSTGVVHRPNYELGDAEVTLKYTLTVGTYSYPQKQILLTVKAMGAPEKIATYDFDELDGDGSKINDGVIASSLFEMALVNGGIDKLESVSCAKYYLYRGISKTNEGVDGHNSERGNCIVIGTSMAAESEEVTLNFEEGTRIVKVVITVSGWTATHSLTINGVTKSPGVSNTGVELSFVVPATNQLKITATRCLIVYSIEIYIEGK